MNIRVPSQVCGAVLSFIALEAALTYGAGAQTNTGTDAALTLVGRSAAPMILASEVLAATSPDPAERSARSIECAQKADAQGLEGKTRRHFLRECKRGP